MSGVLLFFFVILDDGCRSSGAGEATPWLVSGSSTMPELCADAGRPLKMDVSIVQGRARAGTAISEYDVDLLHSSNAGDDRLLGKRTNRKIEPLMADKIIGRTTSNKTQARELTTRRFAATL
ncbi:hypothetical protein B0H67DRAFT_640841 [Lasiosphaeris hirsuta]|uniref:Secreted protein n=1 Tax=Lasiosphaeris hirsuta TaxID=260670 RepID=A0AA40AYC0_9PEZI|nr:hypothetical protein B0H67DRAFT_640841 [Lasiosphaeris hirsuta]